MGKHRFEPCFPLIFIGLRQKGKFYTANFVNFQTLLELTLEILYI